MNQTAYLQDEMASSLKKILGEFNKVAAKAVRDYPESLSFLIVTTDKEILYSAPALQEHGIKERQEKHAFEYFTDKLKKFPSGIGAYAVKGQSEEGHPLSLIGFNSTLYPEKMILQHEMSVFWSLNHEIGHLVVPGAYGGDSGTYKKEALAETYAAIKHVQKYGVQTTFIEDIMAHGAQRMFLEKSMAFKYYHAPALQRVNQLKREMDFAKLTPQQTSALTLDIVESSTPIAAQKQLLTLFKKSWNPIRQEDANGRPMPDMQAFMKFKEQRPEPFFQQMWTLANQGSPPTPRQSYLQKMLNKFKMS